MKLASPTVHSLGVDSFEPFTAAMLDDIVARGCTFVVRYLDNLTAAELALILSKKLVCLFVHSCRAEGWTPSTTDGTNDGLRDVRLLRNLGVPVGVHIFFDLEGAGGTATLVSEHVNAHGAVVKAASYLPALYLGAGCRVSSAQAYSLVSVLYWCGCSLIEDEKGQAVVPNVCGYSMTQGFPPDVVLQPSGAEVDFNYAREDFKKRMPLGVAA